MTNKKDKNPYHPFPSFIFRSPFLSLNRFTEWLKELDRSPDYLKEILLRSDIQEAIFIASPVLYNEIFKYLENRLKPKEKEKFYYSMLKYLSRMATRCTPFGLFAGCSVGQTGEHTDIVLPSSKHYSRHTRLDMNWLCALAQDLAKKREIRYQLRYYPNNSSYAVGDKLRYVEYRYHNGNRLHSIEEVDLSDYLKQLLIAAKEGATVEQLTALITNEEISREEAIGFIDELINNQLLTSELEPGVTGPELLDRLILTLERWEELQEVTAKLKSLSHLLQEIDSQSVGNTIPLYAEIKKLISEWGTAFSEKHLFQSDMLKPCPKAQIDKTVTDEILDAIAFMNKITPPGRKDPMLDKLMSSFLERYEEREVSLAQLLDTEMGLDLHRSGADGDITPLLDGIPFGTGKQENTSHFWNPLQSLLHRKVIESLITKQKEIILTDDDVKGWSAGWDDLPHTLAAMCEVFSYHPNGVSKIYLHSAGGTGAANLLGRFCHVDEEIHRSVIDIIREEEEALPQDKCYAEVVHLPESRTGNILARPVLRPYEIPYLSKPAVEAPFQLEISDLMVSVRQKKFVLRSKKLNREVIPRLTTAHNYTLTGAMPIYQFLCSLQSQGKRSGIGLVTSGLFNEFSFCPVFPIKTSFSLWRGGMLPRKR